KLLRARDRSRHTPIIFVTGHDTTDFPVVEAYKLGAVDYLVKPLVSEIVRAKVAVFVELAQKTRELGRQAEQLRRAQQQQWGVALASIGDAVVVTDAGGRVSFLNPVAAALTGWRPAEAVGRPLAEVFRIINEQTRAPVEDPVSAVIRHGGIVGLAN